MCPLRLWLWLSPSCNAIFINLQAFPERRCARAVHLSPPAEEEISLLIILNLLNLDTSRDVPEIAFTEISFSLLLFFRKVGVERREQVSFFPFFVD